jgi:hypothetical protein
MPDRSSGQDLPEERGRGSHARGSQPQYGAADAHRTEPVNSHRGRNGDGYGPGTPEAYRPVNGNPFGATIRSDYGTGQADPLGARTARTYGTGPADPFGEAGTFGEAGAFGPGNADRFGDTTAAYGTRTAEASTGAGTAQSRPEAEPRTVSIRHAAPDDTADSKGFLGALFDFGFRSFVTPKVIKVLYVLIMIGTVVSALVFTIIAFKASLTFGVVTLLFGDPLFILIMLAIYRIILEFFVVIFRISEDIRALRERGGIG